MSDINSLVVGILVIHVVGGLLTMSGGIVMATSGWNGNWWTKTDIDGANVWHWRFGWSRETWDEPGNEECTPDGGGYFIFDIVNAQEVLLGNEAPQFEEFGPVNATRMICKFDFYLNESDSYMGYKKYFSEFEIESVPFNDDAPADLDKTLHVVNLAYMFTTNIFGGEAGLIRTIAADAIKGWNVTSFQAKVTAFDVTSSLNSWNTTYSDFILFSSSNAISEAENLISFLNDVTAGSYVDADYSFGLSNESAAALGEFLENFISVGPGSPRSIVYDMVKPSSGPIISGSAYEVLFKRNDSLIYAMEMLGPGTGDLTLFSKDFNGDTYSQEDATAQGWEHKENVLYPATYNTPLTEEDYNNFLTRPRIWSYGEQRWITNEPWQGEPQISGITDPQGIRIPLHSDRSKAAHDETETFTLQDFDYYFDIPQRAVRAIEDGETCVGSICHETFRQYTMSNLWERNPAKGQYITGLVHMTPGAPFDMYCSRPYFFGTSNSESGPDGITLANHNITTTNGLGRQEFFFKANTYGYNIVGFHFDIQFNFKTEGFNAYNDLQLPAGYYPYVWLNVYVDIEELADVIMFSRNIDITFEYKEVFETWVRGFLIVFTGIFISLFAWKRSTQ